MSTTNTTTTGTGGAPTCGNGVIDPGEQCDADGQAAGDCHLDCTLRGDPSICGSGVPQIDMNVGMTVAITGDTGTSGNDDVQPNFNSCGGDTGNEFKRNSSAKVTRRTAHGHAHAGPRRRVRRVR